MKIFITISFLLLAAVSANAQQLHFAYLQTDTHKPFYVLLNKKNYSSTASGYIILPKLQNGDYPVRIGFAKNEDAEQEYLLQVKDNDQGLLIKDFGDKGWGLFNLQTMAVQYAGTAAQERAKLAEAQKAEADQRQKKAEEEMLAVNAQRRSDSLKAAGIAQQQYHDSVAAITNANDIRQRNYNDSIAAITNANDIRQRNYNDSIAAIAANNLRQRNYPDSIAAIAANNLRQRNHNDSISTIKITAQQALSNDSLANANAVAAENERLEKIADSTARTQAAVREKLKETNVIVIKPHKKNQPVTPDNNVPHPVDNTIQSGLPLLLQQTFTDSGWHYAYRITNSSKRETVNVFIPARQPMQPVISATPDEQKDTIAATIKTSVDSVNPVHVNTGIDTVTMLQKPSPDTIKNTNVIIAGNAATQQPAGKDSLTPQIEKPILNSNCKALANEDDFFTARRKIASAVGTENMLAAAKKVFKQKCFTTEQLRNLSVLFLTDAGRYQFLDAAYPFAFDAYRYHTLQDLLIDEYYIQRFKAMLH